MSSFFTTAGVIIPTTANITVSPSSGFKVMGEAFGNSLGAIVFLVLIFGLVWFLMKEKIIK